MSNRTRKHTHPGVVALAHRGVFAKEWEARQGALESLRGVEVKPSAEIPEVHGWHHYVTSSGRVYYYREPAPADSLSA